MTEKPLSVLAEVIYGRSPNGFRANTAGYPMYGTGGVVGFAKRPLIDRDAVVIPRKGSLGNPAFAKAGFWAIDTTYVALPKDGVDAKWLYYQLDAFDLTKLNEATGVPSISRDWLIKQRFCTPEPGEQRSIAAVLSAMDLRIEKTCALVSKHRRMRTGLLQSLLSVRSWPLIRIGHLTSKIGSGVTPRGGQDVYVDSGVLFIRSQNVLNEGLSLDDVAYISHRMHSEMPSTELNDDDVLLNITGASIGRACAFPIRAGLANVNQHVCIIRLKHPNVYDSELLAALLCSDIGQQQVNRQISGGNREGLNYKQVSDIALPWPDDRSIRQQIATTLRASWSLIKHWETEITRLRMLKTGLLSDLMSGRVRVAA